jgi:CPA2 family monovalent cation:H+ antiporter-2
MSPNSVFYRDLAYVFVAAVLGGVVARKLRQPLILGYVAAGMIVGPFTPGPRLTDTHTIELLAEIGVILLMYSIGLEFSFRDLMRVKWIAILGAPLSVLLSVALGVGVGQLLGWPTAQGIAVGAIVSMASTMVLMRLLMDRGELHSQHGRVLIGITLCEDLLVVVMTVLIPNLVGFSRSHLLNVAATIGKAMLLIAPLTFVAIKIVPPLMRRVARTRSQELYLLVALALGFATAAATQAIGLSLALGAFLAGMIISSSEYSHETLAQLLPIRDSFVALFFVTIGALIDPKTLVSNPLLLGAIVGLIVVGKLLIGTVVTRLFGYPFWTAVLVGVGITQIGEFSYVLVQVARSSRVVGSDVYNATLAASLISILLNAALMRFVPPRIGKRILQKKAAELADAEAATSLSGHVVLCGYGRVGSAVGTALDTFGVPYVVIEIDPDLVVALHRRNIPCVFGDPAHRTVLQHAGIQSAKLVVITLPGGERSLLAVASVRQVNPDVPLIARAHLLQEQKELIKAGATGVVQPEVEASTSMIRQALNSLDLSEQHTLAYLDSFRAAMESGTLRSAKNSMPLPVVQEVEILSQRKEMNSLPSLQEASVRERFGVTVLAITRDSGEVILNPPAETRIRLGDKLRVFGLRKQIEEFSEHLARN